MPSRVWLVLVLQAAPGNLLPGSGVLDSRKVLERQTFWDNRDWDWYERNIPIFESPDPELDTTYYYRWELVTRHLTYGSPNSGFSFTEFIDRPFWSGAYGAISCPAGHQLYELRWLHDESYSQDYARYWFRTPGAQPRNYSTWLADAVRAVHLAQDRPDFVIDLLGDLVKNYEGWEQSHFTPGAGMFWQTGHDDGMEININSRQTQDTVRGAPGFRPTLNSYMYADALAIAAIADLAHEPEIAKSYRARAQSLKEHVQARLWDARRQFFLQMYQRDEERDGQKIKAGTLTYETGRFAGSEHGRELIGYVPWQFNLPDPGFERAWRFLADPGYFAAPFGPTTVERNDPMFTLSKSCCWWSGQSWPYATTQTLVALANLLNNYRQDVATKADYFKLLHTYALTHRKNSQPYIAEAADPDTGSWEGHDSYNHSEHYFHSGFCDLVITGLVGLRPRDDDVIEVNPLVPDDWDYFALDNVQYHDRRFSIVWDRKGTRYGLGAGLCLFDGTVFARSEKLGRLTAKLPRKNSRPDESAHSMVNFAVNNDGTYYPQVSASFVSRNSSLSKVNDGQFWYLASPPNRWTCEGTRNERDWVAVDFGTPRKVDKVKLYVLGDEETIAAPREIRIERWLGGAWIAANVGDQLPGKPTSHRANVLTLEPIETQKIRAVLTHAPGKASGLSELEAWGPASRPVEPAPAPAGNLAANPSGQGFPKASASFTSRFDRVELVNDGRIFFGATPNNRWTSYESPGATDWLEIDFGSPKEIARLELHVYDDHGGVQAPESYNVQFWDDRAWQDARNQVKTPEQPAGGNRNTVSFEPASTQKVRVVFTHRGKARSGLTEIEAWRD